MEADLCTVAPDPQRCPLFPLETHISEAEKSRRKKVIMSRRVKIDKTKEDMRLKEKGGATASSERRPARHAW
jgi:hypothetical protein